jgi:hypothetical protein
MAKIEEVGGYKIKIPRDGGGLGNPDPRKSSFVTTVTLP